VKKKQKNITPLIEITSKDIFDEDNRLHDHSKCEGCMKSITTH